MKTYLATYVITTHADWTEWDWSDDGINNYLRTWNLLATVLSCGLANEG